MQSEKTDTQKLLIQSLFYGGIDLDANDETYGTPLFAATLRSLQHIVAILLQLGCDPNARSTKVKNTPLHALGINISPKSLDIAKMLLSYGADINAINLNGMTPLDYVRTSYLRIRFKTELEEFLISKGAVYGKDIPHKVLPK
jgi:ankyrin repeat protein